MIMLLELMLAESLATHLVAMLAYFVQFINGHFYLAVCLFNETKSEFSEIPCFFFVLN